MLSLYRHIGSFMSTPRSSSTHLSHTASHAATAAPMYSASVLDSAIVYCFLLLQEIAPLAREKTYLDVDCLSTLYPAQSASVYPSSLSLSSSCGSSRSTGSMTRFGCRGETSCRGFKAPEKGRTRWRSSRSSKNDSRSCRHWTRPCSTQVGCYCSSRRWTP